MSIGEGKLRIHTGCTLLRNSPCVTYGSLLFLVTDMNVSTDRGTSVYVIKLPMYVRNMTGNLF